MGALAHSNPIRGQEGRKNHMGAMRVTNLHHVILTGFLSNAATYFIPYQADPTIRSLTVHLMEIIPRKRTLKDHSSNSKLC